jgi:deoxyribodipyrimidine photolyase-related protein
MTAKVSMSSQRPRLILILGDQLNPDASALSDFDPTVDTVWMAEVLEESTHVISFKQRTTVFLSAMRHFAQYLQDQQWPLIYSKLDDDQNTGTLAGELSKAIVKVHPQKLVMTAPGDWRVLKSLQAVAQQHQIPLELRDDTHFFCTVREGRAYAKERKQWRLEYFYRELRRRTGILMHEGQPLGGQWNFDASNRASFGKKGPGKLPPPTRIAPDEITQEVIRLVNEKLAHHPGSIEQFDWPVTRAQAKHALDEFIAHRLPNFGLYQDAMWEGEVWLYHSHLSCALNLKLLNPREVLAAAEDALRQGHAPLEAVEGFVRQILGWREYVRAIYWTQMPQYLEVNALDATFALPKFYWTGDTEMACLRDAIEQTLKHGYAHHIQRLMVIGLYALLLGVEPRQVHQWYLGVYVDAVEWVELPNTLGMSQFADGGLMASKPYVASGKYINRMSNHCLNCRFNPEEATGETACPFTTLYWDFLMRHHDLLAQNPRMLMQLKNLNRLSEDKKQSITLYAQKHRESICADQ